MALVRRHDTDRLVLERVLKELCQADGRGRFEIVVFREVSVGLLLRLGQVDEEQPSPVHYFLEGLEVVGHGSILHRVVCLQFTVVELLAREGRDLRVHAVLSLQHVCAETCVEEAFEDRAAELVLLSSFLEGARRQLAVVTNEDDTRCVHIHGDEGCWLGRLTGFVDDEVVELILQTFDESLLARR